MKRQLSDYRKPFEIPIGRGDTTNRLYDLEDNRNKALDACAKELQNLLPEHLADFWKQAMPQAMFDLLNSYDTMAAYTAAKAFVEHAARKVGEVKPKGTLTYAELSTILAALREYQRQYSTDVGPQFYPPDCAEHFADVEPLGGDEIDDLCERLNCGQIIEITGGPKA